MKTCKPDALVLARRISAFSDEATAGDPHIGPETLQAIAAALAEADIPTFESARHG
ncbi:MAG: hypothetical protein ACLUE1_04580 [Adlercreutzia equolifaciens]